MIRRLMVVVALLVPVWLGATASPAEAMTASITIGCRHVTVDFGAVPVDPPNHAVRTEWWGQRYNHTISAEYPFVAWSFNPYDRPMTVTATWWSDGGGQVSASRSDWSSCDWYQPPPTTTRPPTPTTTPPPPTSAPTTTDPAGPPPDPAEPDVTSVDDPRVTPTANDSTTTASTSSTVLVTADTPSTEDPGIGADSPGGDLPDETPTDEGGPNLLPFGAGLAVVAAATGGLIVLGRRNTR